MDSKKILKDMVCDEMDEIAKRGEMSSKVLDDLFKATIIKEKLLRCEQLEQDLGYSEGQWSGESDFRGSYRGGSSRSNGSYSRRSSRNGYSSRDKVMDMMDNGEFSYAQSQAIQSMLDESYGAR